MAKYPAKGAKVYFGASNPPTQLIGQLGDSEFDTGDRDGLIDATTHDTSGTRQKLDNKLKQPAKISGEIFYDPNDTNHDNLRGKHESYATGYAKIVLPNSSSSSWTFPARISQFTVGLPVADKMTAKILVEGMDASSFVQ